MARSSGLGSREYELVDVLPVEEFQRTSAGTSRRNESQQIMASITELQAVKTRFGGLVRLDFTAYDLPTAHRLLGQHARQQVQKILKHKLDTWEACTGCRSCSPSHRRVLRLLAEKRQR